MYMCVVDPGWVQVDGLESVQPGDGHVLFRSSTGKDILTYDLTNNNIPRHHLWHASCENHSHGVIGPPDSRNTS